MHKIEPVRNSVFLQSGGYGCLVWREDSEISEVVVANQVHLRHRADFSAYHPR